MLRNRPVLGDAKQKRHSFLEKGMSLLSMINIRINFSSRIIVAVLSNMVWWQCREVAAF